MTYFDKLDKYIGSTLGKDLGKTAPIVYMMKGEVTMANKPGPQPNIKFCPICKGELRNVPRNEMKSRPYVRRDGTIPEHTHTYKCLGCDTKFEINQDQ